jgi:dCMP deaminase
VKMCLTNAVKTRPTVDEWMLGIAEAMSLRSSWPGTKVGCVAAVDARIVSTGYNGMPRGWLDSPDRSDKIYICHAEENVIVQAARYGISLAGAVFYTTMSPCLSCARMLVNVGAKRVVCAKLWERHDLSVTKVLNCADIMLEVL